MCWIPSQFLWNTSSSGQTCSVCVCVCVCVWVSVHILLVREELNLSDWTILIVQSKKKPECSARSDTFHLQFLASFAYYHHSSWNGQYVICCLFTLWVWSTISIDLESCLCPPKDHKSTRFQLCFWSPPVWQIYLSIQLLNPPLCSPAVTCVCLLFRAEVGSVQWVI